ncbi:hypothetical protein FNF29_07346 [Cafeteria roenbergensis]|uniref:Selenoprotein F/M domain-containing protein n=1 Tax=Cafeteria roenbergensis TaxID=33653 RepID=A0A5A8C612_CAFRO|nr:hypothetical protein FNF29_07346 [Cafeteria roenbergensis]|eukprot:KAA0147500.1 hypothetical protein FNF29_07346 [Cafeteria roenbergensis]
MPAHGGNNVLLMAAGVAAVAYLAGPLLAPAAAPAKPAEPAPPAPETAGAPSPAPEATSACGKSGLPPLVGDAAAVRFEVCSSCGFRNRAGQQAQELQKVFPGSKVTVSESAPAFPMGIVADACYYGSWAMLPLFLGGEQVIGALNVQLPPAAMDLLKNKWYAGGAYFALSQGNSWLRSTGAYDVTLGGTAVHSKKATGRFPETAELVHELLRRGAVADPVALLPFCEAAESESDAAGGAAAERADADADADTDDEEDEFAF